MAKRCTVCNKNFPDELNYCPQCGAWAETPGTPRSKARPESPSSGEFVLDPMQPDPPASRPTLKPSSGDFVIEHAQPDAPKSKRPSSDEFLIDPMQPDPPSGVNLSQASTPGDSDVIEIDWEEIDAPAGGGLPQSPPPSTAPTPPQAPPIMAGWQSPPAKGALDSTKQTPAPPGAARSSGDFVLPPSAGDLGPVEPGTVRPVSAPDVTIDDVLDDEGGSEVRLAPRSGEITAWDTLPEDVDFVSAEADRLEEPSAVNLAALATDEPADSGTQLAAAAPARRSPSTDANPRRRGGAGWVGGGLVGAGLATAACLGLWYTGTLDGLRGTPAGNAPVAKAPSEPIKMPTDADAQAKIDQLTAENAQLRDASQQTVSQFAAIQKLLTDSKYLSDQQPNAEAGLSALLTDLANAKKAKPGDGADAAALEKFKKENETLVADKATLEGRVAGLAKLLADAKYLTQQQPDTQVALANALKDLESAKNAKPDDSALRAELDKSKKENEALASDKKKADGQLAALVGLLKDSKFVTDQQPDVVTGVDTLIKDWKKAGDAPAALTAIVNQLRAGNYLTGEDADAKKGLEKLVSEKQSLEKNLADANAMLKNVDGASRDAVTKIKAAEDRAKDATDRLATANRAAEDAAAKLRQSDEKNQEVIARLKAVNDTLQDVTRALVAARVTTPDASGPALVRGIESLVASAAAAPKNGNGHAAVPVRPSDSASPSDPLSAERHYVRGLSNFWEGRYWAAESDFFDAIRAAGSSNPDARFYYFLGLTQLAQGKQDEARAMFKMASALEEQRKPSSAVVSRALERVQGGYRRVVETYRP